MTVSIRGRCWKFGDNVNTDEIIPARYLNTTDEKELGAHCMEDVDRNFVRKVREGDIVVAGENFGCGSSREHAPVALRGCGVAGVIAKSFARIFFRSAINIGFPIVECPAAAEAIREGDELEIDFAAGAITKLTTKEEFAMEPFPEEIRRIIAAGGLMNLVKQRVG
jgi:3-isopropylmalate/(R)-2-methylmalate dehydratase small subunit